MLLINLRFDLKYLKIKMSFDLITNNLDKINAIFLLIFISLLTRLALQYLGQVWITTTGHTATLFFYH